MLGQVSQKVHHLKQHQKKHVHVVYNIMRAARMAAPATANDDDATEPALLDAVLGEPGALVDDAVLDAEPDEDALASLAAPYASVVARVEEMSSGILTSPVGRNTPSAPTMSGLAAIVARVRLRSRSARRTFQGTR